MAKVVARQVVSGSQELVWHLLSDFDRMPDWLPGVTSIEHTGGPPKAFGREHVVQMEGGVEVHQRVVAWDNSRRIAWRITREVQGGRDVGSLHNVRTTIDLRPSAANTEITFTGTWSGGGPLGLIRSLTSRGRIKREFDEALTNLDKLMSSASGGE